MSKLNGFYASCVRCGNDLSEVAVTVQLTPEQRVLRLVGVCSRHGVQSADTIPLVGDIRATLADSQSGRDA